MEKVEGPGESVWGEGICIEKNMVAGRLPSFPRRAVVLSPPAAGLY